MIFYIQNEILAVYKKAEGKTAVGGQEPEQVSDAKVLRAFISFIELLMSHYNLKILIENFEAMDEMSKKAIEYLHWKNVCIVFKG